MDISAETTVITATSVPAGSYIAMFFGDVLVGQLSCTLEAPSGTAIAFGAPTGFPPATMSIVEVATLASSANVRVLCSNGGPPAAITNTRLMLIRTGAIDAADVTPV